MLIMRDDEAAALLLTHAEAVEYAAADQWSHETVTRMFATMAQWSRNMSAAAGYVAEARALLDEIDGGTSAGDQMATALFKARKLLDDVGGVSTNRRGSH